MSSFSEEFKEEAEFLRVTTLGYGAFEELRGFLDRVRTEADRVRRNKVLIDCRQLECRITEAERFQGGQWVAEIFGSRIKVALLMPDGTITKLGELTAVNRGARFFVTYSEDEALKWLLLT